MRRPVPPPPAQTGRSTRAALNAPRPRTGQRVACVSMSESAAANTCPLRPGPGALRDCAVPGQCRCSRWRRWAGSASGVRRTRVSSATPTLPMPPPTTPTSLPAAVSSACCSLCLRARLLLGRRRPAAAIRTGCATTTVAWAAWAALLLQLQLQLHLPRRLQRSVAAAAAAVAARGRGRAFGRR